MARFAGENSKVTAARERKAAVEETRSKAKAEEKERQVAAEWSVGAKQPGKKEQDEQKRLEKLARKNENAQLLDDEEKTMTSVARGGAKQAALAKTKGKSNKIDASALLALSGGGGKGVKGSASKFGAKPSASTASTGGQKLAGSIPDLDLSSSSPSTEPAEAFSASNIDDALALMSTFKNTTSAQAKDLVDRHPERRMKAAFAEYEARRLPELRAEHKSLRLSQVKDILWKEWQKSPENPMNQQQVAYNATQEELDAAVASINQTVQNQLRVRD